MYACVCMFTEKGVAVCVVKNMILCENKAIGNKGCV